MLYPQGTSSDAVQVTAAVTPPYGWKFATALPIATVTKGGSNEFIGFKPVSLSTLIDSPLIAGDHYRKIELTKPGESPMHVIDMVSESDSSLGMRRRTRLRIASWSPRLGLCSGRVTTLNIIFFSRSATRLAITASSIVS